jgi:hypothetical protein
MTVSRVVPDLFGWLSLTRIVADTALLISPGVADSWPMFGDSYHPSNVQS